MKKITAALSLLVSLAACSEQAPPPMVSSGALPPKIALDVQTISLADRSGIQPASSPYNSNHFTPTIDDAVKQWATDRVQATGQTGQAIIVIKDASLTSQPLQLETGFDSWFTRQQAFKYTGHAEVSFEANGREGFATADAAATRSVTLPEDPTPIERQEAYFTLLNGLMKDLGTNLESAIQSHMGNFVVTAPVLGAASAPMTTPGEMAPVQASQMPAPPSTPTVQTQMGNSYVMPSASPPLATSYGQ
jgi:hypothetical protein